MKNCENGINIPELSLDPCDGKTVSTSCVIDPTLYSELGLNEYSSQLQINQALYNAFLFLKAKTTDLQNQIDNL